MSIPSTERRKDFSEILESMKLADQAREEAEARRWSAYMSRLNSIREAFPNGDVSGHCRWHEAEISRIEERTALYRDIRASVIKWGVVALLGWLAVSIWHSVIAAIPHKGG